MTRKTALLLVDVQNDFFLGGALAVNNADKIITPLNCVIEKCREKGIPVFATIDWHPGDHSSFRENGGAWPVHCVQETEGANFHPFINLDFSRDIIIPSGDEREKDGYSGFENEDLLRLLKEKSISTLFVGGLATDYCVRATVLDALKNGFEVFVLSDGINGVDLKPGDSAKAMNEMKKAGAKLVDSREAISKDILNFREF